MLTSLRLSNFQSHKDSALEFHAGVNVILGPSDSGKTALLRALNWVVTNRPSGEAFRSSWGGDTEVEVGLGETTVARRRGKRANDYLIESAEEDHYEFKALGQGVPEEVSAVLNLGDLCVQAQMDAPFLLSETPGEVARVLNRVTRLDEIDAAHSAALSRLTETRRREQGLAADVEAKGKLLEGYAGLEDLEWMVKELEEAEGALRTSRKRRAGVEGLQKALQTSQDRLGAIIDPAPLLSPLREAEGALAAFQEASRRRNAVHLLSLAIERSTKAIIELKEHEELAGGIHRTLEAMEGVLRKKTERRDAILALRNRGDAAELKMIDLAGDLKRLEEEFRRLIPKGCEKCPLFA